MTLAYYFVQVHQISDERGELQVLEASLIEVRSQKHKGHRDIARSNIVWRQSNATTSTAARIGPEGLN